MSEGHGLQTIAALQRLAEKAADTIVELRDENAKLRDVITRAIENTHGHIIGCRFSFGEGLQ